MIKKIFFLFTVFFFISINVKAQRGFKFYGTNNKKQTVKFKLINNLIIIPLNINGKELNFILDTGVNKTILFNLTKNDSLGLKNVKKITLQGLGNGKPVEALVSKNNRFRIDNLISNSQELYVILEDKFELSAKMGITIHGIIGYHFFENVIAKINYNAKRIDIYNPIYFKYPKCKKCEVFPLEFNRNKPYINTTAQLDTVNNKEINVKLLIDSGGSDALWLFEHTEDEIKTPKKYFKDILGEGLSGTIYGNKSKIPKLKLGNFSIEKPTVSFLDTISTFNARKIKGRNGSIGGGILKRFKVWIDYPNNRMTLKKCASLKDGFYYNMSGLRVAYNGMKLIKDEEVVKSINGYSSKSQTSGSNTFSLITSFTFKFKPSFKIDKVIKGSPADLSGIIKDDIILRINGKPAHNFTLDKIIELFQKKPNKKIRLKIQRAGLKLNFEFKLKERI